MKRTLLLAAVAVLALASVPVGAETSVLLGGTAAFPMAYAGLPAGFYQLSPGILLDVEYRLPGVPLLFLKGGAAYRRAPVAYGTGPILTVVELTAGAGAHIALAPKLTLMPYAAAGYHFGSLELPWYTSTGGAWAGRAGVDLSFAILPALGLRVGAAAVIDGGVFLGIQGAVGVSYTFGAPTTAGTAPAKAAAPAEQKPQDLPKETQPATTQPSGQPGNLTLTLSFDDIFPVFHAWYDTNPLGAVVISNAGKQAVTNLKVSFLMKEYMDGRYTSPPVAKLDPGEQVSVPLCALFNQKILDINTPTKALGEITVDYQAGGKPFTTSATASVPLQNRNAMTWIDDERPAAFVTSLEPAAMTFARNVASAVEGKGSTVINAPLRKAMAIHEALNLHKLVYMIDPTTPYTERSKDKKTIDQLQFPRQTLAFKAGDCDDLTILYAALLQSVAVDTAFITIPGHIYVAFSTGLEPDAARALFARADDLIFEGGKAWIPIEVTSRADFLTAWQAGAKEWRENKTRSQAVLYPVAAAWQKYPPVNLPSDGAAMPVAPSASELVAKYLDVQLKFIDREIYEEKAKLTAEITKSGGSAKSVNALGVLYASHGLYDQAEAEFKRAVGKSEYAPSLQNLGTIALARKDYAGSLAYYERAKKVAPHSALTLLGIARVNHELENYGSVRLAYDELKKVSPELATQFAYLDLRGEEATRAADLSKAKEEFEWADQ